MQDRLDAGDEYREAIRLDPKLAAAYAGLGAVFQKAGLRKAAITQYREAIRLDPKFAAPHNGLGAIWEEQGDIDSAATEYQEAIRLDPTFARAHNNLGNVWRKSDKIDLAMKEYQEAIHADAKLALAHYNLGEIWLTLASRATESERDDKLQMACTEFLQGVRLAPKDYDYVARLREISEVDAKLKRVRRCTL